jgi:long-chain acyl-CoA synthetase
VDVEDQNYSADSDKGEVCVKGANVFKGYYKDEKKTKEAFDEDGWLHTGDIGMWLPNGALKIIDRKKHIFKLSQGEYIAPEKIEQSIVQSGPVAQVFIYGYSLKSSLVCIVVPDPETFVQWCASNGENGTYDELCTNAKVNKLVMGDMCKVGKSRGLKSFELPRKIFLSSEAFSVENGLLTPTFKSKRPQLFQRYKEKIDELYVGMD